MSFTNARPVPKRGSGTGVSASVRVLKDGKTTFTLHMNAAFQEEHFGKNIVGENVLVRIGRGTDAGKLNVVLDPEGEIQVVGSVKGAIRIQCAGWDLLGKEARKATPCVGVSGPAGLIVRLPDWANSQKIMDEKFVLKVKPDAGAA